MLCKSRAVASSNLHSRARRRPYHIATSSPMSRNRPYLVPAYPQAALTGGAVAILLPPSALRPFSAAVHLQQVSGGLQLPHPSCMGARLSDFPIELELISRTNSTSHESCDAPTEVSPIASWGCPRMDYTRSRDASKGQTHMTTGFFCVDIRAMFEQMVYGICLKIGA